MLETSMLMVKRFNISQVLDQKGVGQLIKMATEKGRAARPNLKVSYDFE